MYRLTKKEFITFNLKYRPQPDPQVINFIADFVYKNNPENTSNLFSNGYCFHFALILKNLFKKGEICWVAPYSHVVWLYNNVPYDIEGVYSGESTLFIPERFFG